MGHVDEKVSADRIRDFAHLGEVDDAGMAEPPAMISFGLCSVASWASWS